MVFITFFFFLKTGNVNGTPAGREIQKAIWIPAAVRAEAHIANKPCRQNGDKVKTQKKYIYCTLVAQNNPYYSNTHQKVHRF